MNIQPDEAVTPKATADPATANPEPSGPVTPEGATDTTYRLEIRGEQEDSEAADYTERPSRDTIQAQLEAWTNDWAENGDWGDNRGGERVVIEYKWSLYEVPGDEDDEPVEIDSGVGEFELEPDHVPLMLAACPDESARDRLCGTDPDDHDWVGQGGCDTNPGVWATAGTSWKHVSRCRGCGLLRRRMHCGAQRGPSDHDRVEYEMPRRWCADCESEECNCDPAE